MKKLLMFSTLLLGSLSIACAQTDKKVKETKKEEQPAVKAIPAEDPGKKARAQKPMPEAAQSLFKAKKAEAKKP